MDEKELAEKFHLLWHLLNRDFRRSTCDERSPKAGTQAFAHRLEHNSCCLQYYGRVAVVARVLVLDHDSWLLSYRLHFHHVQRRLRILDLSFCHEQIDRTR